LLGAAELALQPLLDDPQRLAGPADVRWIWLTHPDRDHTGALFDLLEAAPQARLVTTFLGAGILSTSGRCRWTGSICSTPANPWR
jgi:flavorubredoxin